MRTPTPQCHGRPGPRSPHPGHLPGHQPGHLPGRLPGRRPGRWSGRWPGRWPGRWLARLAIAAATAVPGAAQDHLAGDSTPPASPPARAIAVPTGSVLYHIDRAPPGLDRLLLARDYDVIGRRAGGIHGGELSLDVAVWPGEVAVFEHLFPTARRTAGTEGLRDVVARRGDLDMGIYFDPDDLQARARALAAAYPERLHLVDLNARFRTPPTAGGRSLLALRVDPAAEPPSTAAPSIVVVGGLHAREGSTVWTALDLARRLAAETADVTGGREVWIVPCANPDGASHAWHRDRWWRKNRNYTGGVNFGVDLNRNFPTAFGARSEPGATDPRRQNYRGPEPSSEAETLTLLALMGHLRPELWLDLHTHGRVVLAGRTGAPTDAVVRACGAELAAALGYQWISPPTAGLAVAEVLRGGGLGLVVELGRAFQPHSAAVQLEADRLWQALQPALLWRPALRGRVIDGRGQPLPATISWGGPGAGTACEVRARDGRFAMWLGDGMWRLRVAAPGIGATEVTVQVEAGLAADLEVQLEPSDDGLHPQREGR